MRKQKRPDLSINSVAEIKELYNKFLAAGFTSDQALQLTITILQLVIK